MKNYSIIFIVLLLVSPLHVIAQDCSNNTPKIPSYLGKGYDIVYGNPSTNTIDPGFRYEVIAFDYKDGITTEDKKFLCLTESLFRNLSLALTARASASSEALNHTKMT